MKMLHFPNSHVPERRHRTLFTNCVTKSLGDPSKSMPARRGLFIARSSFPYTYAGDPNEKPALRNFSVCAHSNSRCRTKSWRTGWWRRSWSWRWPRSCARSKFASGTAVCGTSPCPAAIARRSGTSAPGSGAIAVTGTVTPRTESPRTGTPGTSAILQ